MLLSEHDINECMDYPGKYIPLPETELLMQQLQPDAASISTPLLNMDEFIEYYQLVMVIPGSKREDVLVYIHGNILSVAAAHKTDAAVVKKATIHEFDTKCFERHISLPQDADTAFIHAAFSEGLLKLYIPKSGDLAAVPLRQVVVY